MDKRRAPVLLWSGRHSSESCTFCEAERANDLTTETISFFCYSAKIIVELSSFSFLLFGSFCKLPATSYKLQATSCIGLIV